MVCVWVWVWLWRAARVCDIAREARREVEHNVLPQKPQLVAHGALWRRVKQGGQQQAPAGCQGKGHTGERAPLGSEGEALGTGAGTASEDAMSFERAARQVQAHTARAARMWSRVRA